MSIRYIVEKRTDTSDWVSVMEVQDSTCKVVGLSAGVDYQFRVKAVNEVDGVRFDGEYSDVVEVSTLKDYTVGVPTNLEVESTYNSVTVRWGEVESAIGYEVEYSTDRLFWTRMSRVVSNRQTIPSLSEAVEYHVRVRSVGNGVSGEIYSAFSDVSSIKTKVQDVGVPQSVQASLDGQTLNISWSVVDLATSYEVDLNVDSAGFVRSGDSVSSSYSVDVGSFNTNILVRVRSVREVNGVFSYSDYSSEVEVVRPSTASATLNI